MDAGDGELDPFGDVCRVVADALEVFCYHQKIQRVLRVAAAGADHFDKRGFHAQKAIVNHVVVLDDASCKGKVALIIRDFEIAFAIAAILMALTVIINLVATLVGKYYQKRRSI